MNALRERSDAVAVPFPTALSSAVTETVIADTTKRTPQPFYQGHPRRWWFRLPISFERDNCDAHHAVTVKVKML